MFAELTITDGSTFVLDLLGANKKSGGIALSSYTPGRVNLKGGGIWQDSPLASGRRLVDGVRGNVADALELKIAYPSQNAIIQMQQGFDAIIEAVDDYWMTSWQAKPIYLTARAPGEYQKRYAVIYHITLDGYPDPYHEPFAGRGRQFVMDGLIVGIERSPWMDNPPQTSSAVLVSHDIQDANGDLSPAAASLTVASRYSDDIGFVTRYNGTTYASNPLESAFTANYTIFYPDTLSTSHITYFGGGKPFGGLVFDIATPMSASSWTITWEYWNGSAWTALTVADGTNKFSNTGRRLVTFKQPQPWATTAVNGVTLYWVQARISALTGAAVNPTQQNRHIYAACRPFAEIDSAQVTGDLDALAKIALALDASTTMRSNQVFAGLRTLSRGSNFRAYINVKTADNPSGVSVTLTTDNSVHATLPTYSTDSRASTGFLIESTMATTEDIDEIFRVSLASSIINEYRGRFRLMARVARTGASDVTQLRAVVESNTSFGGFTASRVVGEKRALISTNYSASSDMTFEIVDLGQVQLPLSDMLRPDETPDTTHIIIEGIASGLSDSTIYFNDLILLPIDEWSIEASANSVLTGNVARTVEIDSIGYPKQSIRTILRNTATNAVIVAYRSITSQEAVLHANVDQRLWFVLSEAYLAGASESNIELAALLSLQKNERYFNLRADS